MKLQRLIFNLFIIANISLDVVHADILDELFQENQVLKKSINALQMECSEMTVQCIERENALQSVESFNADFEEALQRNIDEWPNNELDIIKQSLNLRRAADEKFKDGFFGRAQQEYDEASQMISDVLDEADRLLEENLRIGENYLYERDKPEWAASYFNNALRYAPGDERVKRGIDVINFRKNFEKDFSRSEELISIGEYAEAVFLLEKLLGGSPDEQRMKIQELLAKAKANLQIKEIEGYAKDFNEAIENGEDKIEVLKRINNAIEIYGENSSTLSLIELRNKIKEEAYAESFNQLREDVINESKGLEELFQIATSLTETYPNENELNELFDTIAQKRNEQRLNEIKVKTEDLIKNEKWDEASAMLLEAIDIENTEEINNQNNLVNEINAFIKDSEDIMNNSTKRLDNRNKTNAVRRQVENIKNVSKNIETPKLDQTIKDLESKLGTYESLIAEEEKSRQANQRTNNRSTSRSESSSSTASNRSSNTSQSQTNSASQSSARNNSGNSANRNQSTQNNINTVKPTLNMSSFQDRIVCEKRIRNKKITAIFSIDVSSSGKALSAEAINADEFRGSAEKAVIKILRTALLKAEYVPGKRNGLNVDSNLQKKLTAPSRFCD